MKIEEIEGIGEVFAAKLNEAGITSLDGLLEKAASRSGRESLAEAIGVDAGRVLEWVNRADLMRVRGVGSEYSDLLEAAGVDSVPELAQRNAANLHAAIQKTISEKGLVRRPPSAAEVEGWISHAKDLGRTVTH